MFNRFAAGKKVYGQGSYAPTKGQVSPQGYIQREIKKRNQQALGQRGGVSRVGNDGMSDTRSGVAGRILNNRPRPAGAGKVPQAVVRGNGGGNSQRPTATRDQSISNAPVSTQAPPTPTVNITPTGALELPYGSEFANQVLDAQMQFDADMLALQQEEQQNELDYQTGTRNLNQSYEEQQDNTRNTNAAAGTAFSSAYGTGVNEDARNFNNMKNQLDTGYNNFKTGATSRRNLATTALNSFIQRAMQSYADSLAPEAGELGFGTDGAPAEAATAAAPAAWDRGAQMPASIANNGWAQMAANMGNNNKDKDKKGDGRPPKPGPNYVWRDGKWKKDK